jgi:uncharacterized protein involved in response to NO
MISMHVEPRKQPHASLASLVRDPWRVFFPLGVLLGWTGVLHWLLYAFGVSDEYRAVFHATAQIQGFLTCIAIGFLYTFIPRRTGTSPPSLLEIVAGAAAPVAATLAAWLGGVAVAQAAWLAGVTLMAAFVGRRVLSPGGGARVPGVFVWVPVALLAGISGAALVGIVAVVGPREEPQLWHLGRGLLLQGFVTALVVGVGGTMIPTLTRGEAAPRATPSVLSRRGTQAIAALAFLASFPVEVYLDPRAGHALRALVAGGVLVAVARLWRPPTMPGLHRRLIWVSAWFLPVGYGVAAAAPELRSAALHLVFIGSFTVMALSVSLHVALSHGGRPERLAGWPWPVWAMALLLGAAAAFRFLVGFDAAHLKPWLACAALCFFLATAAWAWLVVPAIRAAGGGARDR